MVPVAPKMWVLSVLALFLIGVRCDWLGSPLQLSPEQVASDVGYGVLVTGTSFDSTCYAGTDKLRCADVALAFPSSSPFCSGTLVAGPQDRTFIVTARHCAETMWEFIVYPMSSYYVLFDYRLPCNATEARPGSFQKVAQGLSVLFMDVHSDVMVLELLQDVPPEWGQYTAGIDAQRRGLDVALSALGHPQGDAQKFYSGGVVGACNESDIVTNKTEHVDCTKHTCGFYQFVVNEGDPGPGCSGGGIVDEEVEAVIGTLSGATDSRNCPASFATNGGDAYGVFGSLAAAWQHGMYATFAGERGNPPKTTYQPHTRPVPTISIGNISPILYTAEGPTRVSIKLQQAPQQPVVHMTVKNLHPFLISTNVTSLTFTAANWNASQIIQVAPGTRTLEVGQAEEFGLVLRWNVVRGDGAEMHRTKHIRGMIWNARRGSAMLHQQPVTLPLASSFDFQDFMPDAELARERGPVAPGVYLNYTPNKTQGINATVCWVGGPSDRGDLTVAVRQQSYSAHWMQARGRVTAGCTSTVALLSEGKAVTFTARRELPDRPDNVQFFPPGVAYPFTIHVDELSKETALSALSTMGIKYTTNSSFSFKITVGDTRIVPIIVELNETTSVTMSTCHEGTVWGASFALLDDDLNIVVTSEPVPGNNCAATQIAQLAANKKYIVKYTPVYAPILVTGSSHVTRISMTPVSW